LLDIAKGKTLPIGKLSEVNKRILIAASKSMLSGVGQIPSVVESFQFAIHYRRSLTEEEICYLPGEWCALPAIDEGGLGELIERDT